MNDRSIDDLGDFSAVVRRSILLRERGKADLIVEDNVNYTTSTIINEVLELNGLINDSLSCNCSVSVDDNS